MSILLTLKMTSLITANMKVKRYSKEEKIALVNKVKQLTEKGMNTLKACERVGISRPSLTRWEQEMPVMTFLQKDDEWVHVKDDLITPVEMCSLIKLFSKPASKKDFLDFLRKVI